jgi:hypothetical protein
MSSSVGYIADIELLLLLRVLAAVVFPVKETCTENCQKSKYKESMPLGTRVPELQAGPHSKI